MFRKQYLDEQRKVFDILVLAETGVKDARDEVGWGADWKRSHTTYWASGPRTNKKGHTGTGMSVMIGNSIPVKEDKKLYEDPEGRSIIIRLKIHNKDTILIGLHTDTHTTQSHKESIERIERALESITIHPETTVILATDLNNYLTPHLDHMNSDGKPSAPHAHPEGREAILRIASTLKLKDTFRELYPRKREFTHKCTTSKSRIDYLMTSEQLFNKKSIP